MFEQTCSEILVRVIQKPIIRGLTSGHMYDPSCEAFEENLQPPVTDWLEECYLRSTLRRVISGSGCDTFFVLNVQKCLKLYVVIRMLVA